MVNAAKKVTGMMVAVRTIIWWTGDIQTVQELVTDRIAIANGIATIARHPILGLGLLFACLLVYRFAHRTLTAGPGLSEARL